MAEWIVCPECQLKHSIRPDRRCPRCGASIDPPGTAPPPPPEAPPPVPDEAKSAMYAETIAVELPPLRPQPPSPAEAAAKPACVNHPDVTEGLMTCDSCGRTFCSECVVVLSDGVYCRSCRGDDVVQRVAGASAPRLGVMDAVAAGWRTASSDFWPTWLLGLVFLLISAIVSLPGIIPIVGIVWGLAVGLVVMPQLQAGLVLAVTRKIDGGGASVDGLFEGFKQRFAASLVLVLPVWGAAIVVPLVLGALMMLVMGPGALAGAEAVPEQPSAFVMALMMIVMIIGVLAVALVQMVSWFGFVALWHGHESGGRALGAGLRVVREHPLPTVGLVVVYALVVVAASLVGVLALCVGYLVTLPIAIIWLTATTVRLYRSWSI